jgi:hypothetical protein
MLIFYCLGHCIAISFEVGSEFMRAAVGMFVMLSATTEHKINSISLSQSFAMLGYTLF